MEISVENQISELSQDLQWSLVEWNLLLHRYKHHKKYIMIEMGMKLVDNKWCIWIMAFHLLLFKVVVMSCLQKHRHHTQIAEYKEQSNFQSQWKFRRRSSTWVDQLMEHNLDLQIDWKSLVVTIYKHQATQEMTHPIQGVWITVLLNYPQAKD